MPERTFRGFMEELGRDERSVVQKIMRDSNLKSESSCIALLQLSEQGWHDAAVATFPAYFKDTQETIARHLKKHRFDFMMQIDRENKEREATAAMAPYKAAVTVCETEYEELVQWKRDEPDPLQCHKNDGVLLALETVIRHFKLKGQ